MKRTLVFICCLALGFFNEIQCLIVGSNGAVELQGVISFPAAGSDNEMRGFSCFYNGFRLENSATSVLFNSFYPVSGLLRLNGGTLNLGRDMVCKDVLDLSNVGTINGNNHTLSITTTNAVPSSDTGPLYANFITDVARPAQVFGVAWSPGSNYLAVSGNNATGAFSIYSFDGTTLTQAAASTLGAQCFAIDWQTTGSFIAFARNSGAGNALQIFSFAPPVTLTAQTTANLGAGIAANAAAWTPGGTHVAVAMSNSNLRLYPFTPPATLGTASTQATTQVISRGAVSWDPTGIYIVCGAATGTVDALQVYSRTGNTLNALQASAHMGYNVNAVSWSPTNSWIAVGLSGSNDNFHIFQFSATSTLLNEVIAARTGESSSVLSLAWHPTGSQLVMGCGTGATTEFKVYNVNQTTGAMTVAAGVDSFYDVNIVDWSRNGLYTARGDNNARAGVYTLTTDATAGSTSFLFTNLNTVSNSDINLTKSITTTGVCTIDMQNHTLNLGSSNLVVGANSTLLLKNATVKNVSSTNVSCAPTSVLALQNVAWQQSANTTFTSGALLFSGDVIMQGGGTTFAYNSAQTSTILANSILYLDEGFTFSYAPASSSRNLFQFTDTTAQVQLHGATWCTSTTGMHFGSGKMSVLSNSFISSGTDITFGNDSAAGDFIVEIASGTRLQCTQGTINYKNILTSSWSAMQNDSNFYIGSGSTLRLYENLDVGNGTLTLEGGTTLAIASGKQFIGSIFTLGAYTYSVF